jgi:hypothetical protein
MIIFPTSWGEIVQADQQLDRILVGCLFMTFCSDIFPAVGFISTFKEDRQLLNALYRKFDMDQNVRPDLDRSKEKAQKSDAEIRKMKSYVCNMSVLIRPLYSECYLPLLPVQHDRTCDLQGGILCIDG